MTNPVIRPLEDGLLFFSGLCKFALAKAWPAKYDQGGLVDSMGLSMFLEMRASMADLARVRDFAEAHPPIQEGWAPKAWSAAEKTGLDPWDACAQIATLQQKDLAQSDATWLGLEAAGESARCGDYASLMLALRLDKVVDKSDADEAATAPTTLMPHIVETAISDAVGRRPELFTRRAQESASFALAPGRIKNSVHDIQEGIILRAVVAMEESDLAKAVPESADPPASTRRPAL